MALRSVAVSPAGTSLMHPWSEISFRSTLIQLVGPLEVQIEGRVLLRPWLYPSLLGKLFPRFPQLYTSHQSPVIISALLKPRFVSHSQPDRCFKVVDASLGTSECLDNKIPFVFFPCLISVFSLSQDHLPAIHPVWSSACLAAWNPSLPVHLLPLFPTALVLTTINLWFNSHPLSALGFLLFSHNT